MRYSPTERKGVNAVEKIFLDDFEWVFREQFVVDVGIDALVEESIAGNPTAKFIAVQIKSGKGNFLVSNNRLTYYVSKIHYHYWLSFEMPVLLIAHLPESNETYWVEISKRTLKKVKKRWKLEIPYSNRLNFKAKPALTKLLTSQLSDFKRSAFFDEGTIDEETIYDVLEKGKCLNDSKESTIKTVETMNDFSKKIIEHNKVFHQYSESGLIIDSPQVKSALKTLAKIMNICSSRLESECDIFAQTFSHGIYAHAETIMYYSYLTGENEFAIKSLASIQTLAPEFNNAIQGIKEFRDSVFNLPSGIPILQESKERLISVIDVVISEYETGKNVIQDLVDSIVVLLEKSS